MKYIRYLFVFICCFLCLEIVYASDIKSIDMDIYIDENGNANVIEKWLADVEEDTEGYKPYYNLGNSEITNFSVEFKGRRFTTLSTWDVDATFSEKAYKAGINPINNGYELCFGVSSYGSNNLYTLRYTITNFVSQTSDADMVYWQLIPYDLSDKPERVYVKIHSFFDFDNDLPVWGYGYGKDKDGYAYVYDGYIELTKDSYLDSDEYITVLVKFPKDTFKTSSILANDFTHYLDMAENGATTYSDTSNKVIRVIMNIMKAIGTFILNVFPYLIAIICIAVAANYTDFGTKKIKIKKEDKKFKDVPYFRDLPCDKDIFKAYWVAGQYKLIKNKTDFLGAILLKWLKNKNIMNVNVQKKKKEERGIKLLTSENLSIQEKKLYDMISLASEDGVLEKYEFENWCKANYKQILNWFNSVIDDITKEYIEKGLVIENKKTFQTELIPSDMLNETAKQMAGLKKFLEEFSNIKDRQSIEVMLWEEYLMYAQIFGIASEVAKEFKKLYPDIITDEYYDDVIFIHTISYTGVKAASAAKSRAESYSAGGGGFSSSGGGGGSFGGGGGGGGFR